MCAGPRPKSLRQANLGNPAPRASATLPFSPRWDLRPNSLPGNELEIACRPANGAGKTGQEGKYIGEEPTFC